MESKEKNKKLISAAFQFSNNIKRVKDANYHFRKGSKQNFNFFSAIVSGKHSKDHHEKYHSNFIAYLINPSASHDFDTVFLKLFLEELKKKTESSKYEFLKTFPGFEENELQLRYVNVEREKPVNGSLDIAIESKKNKWIIFIENKVEHYEAIDQVKDYCKWAEESKNDWIGVFLTKEGIPPSSVNETNFQNKVVCLSYQDIIHWLTLCCTNEKVIYYPHVVSAIKQYINIIKKNLRIMDENEIKEISDLINDNIKDAALLIEYLPDLKKALDQYIKDAREKFLKLLLEELEEKLNKEGIIKNHLVYKYKTVSFKLKVQQMFPEYDERGRGLWWGIYNLNDEPFKDLKCESILRDNFWEPIYFQNIEDFEKDTDIGSAIIVKSLKEESNLRKIINEITNDIVKKTKRIVELILDQSL